MWVFTTLKYNFLKKWIWHSFSLYSLKEKKKKDNIYLLQMHKCLVHLKKYIFRCFQNTNWTRCCIGIAKGTAELGENNTNAFHSHTVTCKSQSSLQNYYVLLFIGSSNETVAHSDKMPFSLLYLKWKENSSLLTATEHK